MRDDILVEGLDLLLHRSLDLLVTVENVQGGVDALDLAIHGVIEHLEVLDRTIDAGDAVIHRALPIAEVSEETLEGFLVQLLFFEGFHIAFQIFGRLLESQDGFLDLRDSFLVELLDGSLVGLNALCQGIGGGLHRGFQSVGISKGSGIIGVHFLLQLFHSSFQILDGAFHSLKGSGHFLNRSTQGFNSFVSGSLVGIDLSSQQSKGLVLSIVNNSLVLLGFLKGSLEILNGICYQLLVLGNSILESLLVGGNVLGVLVDSGLEGVLGLFQLLGEDNVGSSENVIVGLQIFGELGQLGINLVLIGLEDKLQRVNLSFQIHLGGLQLILQILNFGLEVFEIGGFHLLRTGNDCQRSGNYSQYREVQKFLHK